MPPALFHRQDGFGDALVAAAALHQLGKHQQDFGFFERDLAEIDELEVHAFGGAQMGARPVDALLDEGVAQRFGDQLDQGLLGRYVVVQRRHIDADAIGNVAGAQALDAVFDDQGAGRCGDRRAPVIGRKAAGSGRGFHHGGRCNTPARCINQSFD